MDSRFFEFLEQAGPISGNIKNTIKERLMGPFLFKKGTILLKEGEVNHTIYFLEKGMARIFYTTNNKQVTSRFIPENSIAISYFSYFTQEPSVESLDVLEASTVYALHRADLEETVFHYPELNRHIQHVLAQALISSDERSMMIRKLSAAERYEALLKAFPSIFLRASVDHIASFLGITRETLSRIRSIAKCDIYHKS